MEGMKILNYLMRIRKEETIWMVLIRFPQKVVKKWMKNRFSLSLFPCILDRELKVVVVYLSFLLLVYSQVHQLFIYCTSRTGIWRMKREEGSCWGKGKWESESCFVVHFFIFTIPKMETRRSFLLLRCVWVIQVWQDSLRWSVSMTQILSFILFSILSIYWI